MGIKTRFKKGAVFCLCCIVVLSIYGFAYAEVPPVEKWSLNLVQAGYFSNIQDMTIDHNENIYVTGTKASSSPSFFRRVVTTAKFDTFGTLQWITDTPSDYICQDMYGDKVIVDSSGNVYVTGYSSCGLNRDDMLAIKYDERGEIGWISHLTSPQGPTSGASWDRSASIDVDSAGNVYLTGTLDRLNGFFDLATVKFDADGNNAWVKTIPITNIYDQSSGSLVRVGNDGKINVSGRYSYQYGYSATPHESGLIFLKYDTDGTLLKETKTPLISAAEPKSLFEDVFGNMYVASAGTPDGSNEDYVVVKYDREGNQVWRKDYNSMENSHDYPKSLAVNTAGDAVYVTGFSLDNQGKSKFGTLKYDANGNLQQLTEFSHANVSSNVANKVSLNSSGDVYVAGNSGSSSAVNSYYIVKYDAVGNELWTLLAILGDSQKAAFRSMHLGQNGQDIYIASPSVIAKFGPLNNPPAVNAGGPYTVSEGTVVTLVATGSDPDGDALTYAWDVDNNGSFDTEGQSVTIAVHDGPASYQVSVQVTDTVGQISQPAHTTITVRNVAPSAVFENTSGAIDEGGLALITATQQYDPSSLDTAAGFSYSYDCTNDGIFELSDSPNASYSCSYLDNGIYTVKGRIADKDGGFNEYIVEVTVNNVAPTVGAITAPTDPAAVNTTLNVSAQFTDPGILDTHTAVWNWGDGSFSDGNVNEAGGSGTVSGSHSYTEAGVYTVTLTVTDKDGASAESLFKYIVVYDPSAGFVTGGGWINSPSGAYNPNLSIAGKANFGFVAKYKKGATVPDGQTEFNFSVANLNFHSASYQWLVVAGAHAKYKGSGTINGIGDYGFMLTATDGQQNGGGGTDAFRIKIWDKGSGAVIYDNQMSAPDDSNMGTVLGGGSIVIHNK